MDPEIKVGVVTSSSHQGTSIWIACGFKYLLLDLGRPSSFELPVKLPPFQPSAVILSHAHLGHAGGVIEGWKAWCDVPFFATKPTLNLLSVQLFHTNGHLSSLSNTNNHILNDLPSPPFFGVPFTNDISPLSQEPDLNISFIPSGHLYGASALRISWNGCTILYLSDCSINSFGGNPGFSVELTKCDILITQLPPERLLKINKRIIPSKQFSTGWTSILFSTDAKKIIVPLQPAGALQETLLDLGRNDWNAIPECRLLIDPFSFALCQAISPVKEKLEKLTWVMPNSEFPWYTSGKEGNSPELFLCGSASLWPDSPSGKLVQNKSFGSKAIVWLGEDAINGSPARALLSFSRSNSRSKEPNQFTVAELCLPPRKASREEILTFVRKVNPRNVVFLEHRPSTRIENLGSIHQQFLRPGEIAGFERK